MDVSSPPHVSPLMGSHAHAVAVWGGPVPRQSLLQCHPTGTSVWALEATPAGVELGALEF